MKNTLRILLFLVVIASLSSSTIHFDDQVSERELIEYVIDELRSRDTPSNQSVYPLLEALYEQCDYRPLWSSRSIDDGITILNETRQHGLKPDDYLSDEILSLTETRTWKSSIDSIRTDVYLSYGMLLFGKHMTEGRVNPEYFYENWHYQRLTSGKDLTNKLITSLKENDLQNYLRYITPPGDYYKALIEWMKEYHSGKLKDNGKLHFDKMPIRKGDKGTDILELKYRLVQYGNLADQTLTSDFDDVLEDAVKEFQRVSGLTADGIIGKETLKALNLTLEEKENIVRVNMERARWLKQDYSDNLLLVNIAGYEAYLFDKSRKLFQTPVIVGKIEHETPIFYSGMEYIEFNPAWVVPRSITINEILPILKRNPGYLSSMNFEVLWRGLPINTDTVKWAAYSQDYFPFILRQKPGPSNALGRIKFVFPNSYSVYLHDTPAKYLFDNGEPRAFSHGCVRVKDPEILAELILAEQGITGNQIDSILNTKETQRIYLSKQIPVVLTYWTVFPEFPLNNSGKLHWVKDIYGRDEAILNALN